MLVLSRKMNESIVINDNVIVTVVEIRGDKIRLGIEAPRDVTVHRREVYDAIKRVTFTMGAVERDVLASRPARGDVAQLLSVSGDIWYATRDNVFGKERAWLHLLLRHCGVSCDILHEDELAASLAPYRVLFANDAHLKRAALAPLTAWVRGGGVLVLGAGALTSDEFGEPLGLDAALGLSRGPLVLHKLPGRAEHEMLNLKPLGEHAGIPLLCATNAPLEQTLAVDKGRVVQTGFFPGISYIATSKRPDAAEYSVLDFEAAHRNWMTAFWNSLGIASLSAVISVTLGATAASWAIAVGVGLAAFRFFDILKPPPVRQLERLPNRIERL